MDSAQISPETYRHLMESQVAELTDSLLYAFMAKREKNEANRAILRQMSSDEQGHAATWRGYTGLDLSPRRLRLFWYQLVVVLLGFTFMVKMRQKEELAAEESYRQMAGEIPEAARVMADERRHEQELYGMLDEERLHYVGAMVLGLNDALVELTGALAGVTFALANTRLVALTGIITGIAATLSMGASQYLAARAENHPHAFKASAYTGIAYLITVGLLVLPYLLFPTQLYAAAFACMIAIVLLIILFFNYYISVARDEPFLRRFGEMAVISVSVAAISFIIGIIAKNLLGIDA